MVGQTKGINIGKAFSAVPGHIKHILLTLFRDDGSIIRRGAAGLKDMSTLYFDRD